jgi:hypothetical protein
MTTRNDVTIIIDPEVAAGFGHEWSTFRQSEDELSTDKPSSSSIFHIFPWKELPPSPIGIDVSSGRWSAVVAPRVGHLHLLDASKNFLVVARHHRLCSSGVRKNGQVERTFHYQSTSRD